MQPAPQVSSDGKYWWDDQTWQKLPTSADAPEIDVVRAAGPAHHVRVIVAVVLWAVLLVGIGIVALGAIVLIDLLIPGHPESGGLASGAILIAVGGLVGLPTVLQSGWFTRPANRASIDRSWITWVLWPIVVLGIGLVALGMVALLDLLSPHHSKTLTAAPGLVLIGLGGLVCLGPTLRLLGFGLLISRRNRAPRSPKLIRPQSRSQTVPTRLVISSMVLLLVAVIVGTARQAGIGAALVAGLATAVAFGIPASIAWVRQRGNQSQEPTLVIPPPPLTSPASTTVRPTLILRPTPSARWVTLLFLLALAGGLVGLGVRAWISGDHDIWALIVIAAIFVAMAYSYWSMYIQADDKAIVVRFVVTRRYDRREVVAIRIGLFVISYYGGSGSRVRFLRSDGSVLFTTLLYWWGMGQLETLASYLGIPIERAD